MKKFRAGVIGVGFIGAVHIEQLRRLGNVDVVAIADESGAAEKAKALFVPNAYDDYRKMIDCEKPDCVHVCTPNNTHFDIVSYALKHGVNVVCEKPMTVGAEKARVLCNLARETGLVNAVNFNCRFYPMAYQMRQMVQSGEVGDIYTVHGGYLQDWLYLDTDYSWRLEPEFTGASRAFADIGSHWLDLVEYITGLKTVEVMADFAVFHKTRKKPLKAIDTYSGMALRPEDYEKVPVSTEDYAALLLHMENGAHVCCNISQMFAGRKNQMTVSIAGSKCSVHWDSENSNALWIGRRECANGELVKDPSILPDATGRVISYPGGHVEGFPDTFKQNFRKIYNAVAGGRREDYADFEDGFREALLCEKIVESAEKRRWVTVGEI